MDKERLESFRKEANEPKEHDEAEKKPAIERKEKGTALDRKKAKMAILLIKKK